jgi:hypothetical protein
MTPPLKGWGEVNFTLDFIMGKTRSQRQMDWRWPGQGTFI